MEETIVTEINDETVVIEEDVIDDVEVEEEDFYTLPLYDEEGNLIQDEFIGTENEENKGSMIDETEGGFDNAN